MSGRKRKAPTDHTTRPIFHITQVANLPSIVEAGFLYSDSACRTGAATPASIGYAHIKARRLARSVRCAAGGVLGDYVPFNFCPRSVMLYPVSKGHDDYQGGQEQVVHLRSTIARAIGSGRPYAFTDRHADLAHALYFDDVAHLDEVRWSVMPRRVWIDVKEERQAEFLVHERLPWDCFTEIGCMTEAVANQVRAIVGDLPAINVRREWYYP